MQKRDGSMFFYEELKDIRKNKGFTIREVAERSGVSSAYISQLENGQRGTPSPDILSKLSGALETPYPVLMQLAGYLQPEQSEAMTRQKPVNLRRLLRENDIILDGRLLTGSERRWIDRMLTAMFSKDE